MDFTPEERQLKAGANGQLVFESAAEAEQRFVRNGCAALDVCGAKGALTEASTKAEVIVQIQAACDAAIKTEITTDPMQRGYAGKTDAEIAVLLNAPYIRQVSQPEDQPARWTACYPQEVTEVDVTFAKALVPVIGDPAHLQLAKLQAEINRDPKGRGYAGKTDQQIADLLNAVYSVVVSVPHPSFPRITVALNGLPYAPNAVTAADVGAANG